MKTFLGILFTTVFLSLKINAAEVWISPVGTGPGSGTAADPYICNTATSSTETSFDTLMNSATTIPANSTIHLMAGTFLTLQGITLKSGWKIVGAGMDVTVVKLGVLPTSVTNGSPKAAVWDMVIGGLNIVPSGNYWYWANPDHPRDNISVSDLTVDINAAQDGTNQAVRMVVGAVGLAGHNSRISRVKAINWGSTAPGESFLIVIGNNELNDSLNGEIKKNAVIEGCIIGAAAPKALVDGVSAINIIGGDVPPAMGWIEGGEIRNCFVKDIECAVGGGVGKPTYFHAFSCAGIGMKVRNNIAVNLGPVGAVATGSYMETGSYVDYVIENNMFLDVAKGIYLNDLASNTNQQRNLFFRNNLITVKSGGAGIALGGFAGGVSGANKPLGVSIQGNSIYGVAGATSIEGIGISDTENVTVENNTIGAGTGIGVNLGAGVTVGRIENNRNLDGTLVTTSGNFSTEHHEKTFTPSTGGWYRLLALANYSAGTFHIYGSFDGRITDLEFTYDIPYEAWNGNVTVLRNMPYGLGHVSKIRISNDPWVNPAGKVTYVDIYIPSVGTPAPLSVEWSPGPKNPYPQALGNISNTPVGSGATPPAGAEYERILEVGRGFRTSAPIYAGASTRQVTDDDGKVLAGALPNLPVGNLNGGTGASSDTFWRGDGTWAVAGPSKMYKSLDQSFGTTVGDVTGLSFPVSANTDYGFDFTIIVRTTATTEGYQLTLNGPGTFTARVEMPSTSTAQIVNYGLNTYGTLVTVANGPGNTVGFVARITGSVQNGGTPGTLTVRARSEAAVNGVTIKKGSWGHYWKL